MVNNWYQSLFFFLTLDDSVERIYNPCRTQLSSHRHVRGRFNAMRRTRWSVAALSVGSRADARVTAWTRVNISFHARPFPSNNVVNVIYKLSLILSSVKIKLVAFRGDRFFFFFLPLVKFHVVTRRQPCSLPFVILLFLPSTCLHTEPANSCSRSPLVLVGNFFLSLV